jgi:hypothetical protein
MLQLMWHCVMCVRESRQNIRDQRFVTAIEGDRMEMGRNGYGFHCGIATYTRWL